MKRPGSVRALPRTVLHSLAAIALTTCGDAPPTSPTGGTPVTPIDGLVAAQVTLSLGLAADAVPAYERLLGTTSAVADLHVQLTGFGGGSVDTVIASPSLADSLRLEIPYKILGTETPLAATFELRTAERAVLFSATQTVTARAISGGAAVRQAITLSYAGPGRSIASMSLTPSDTLVRGAATLPLNVIPRDASSSPVADAILLWSSSDASVATIVPAGPRAGTLHSTGKRGSTTLTATTPLGVSATARVAVLPVPTQLAVVSGAAQVGGAGSALTQPLVVEVRAGDNLPVPGIVVSFRAVTPGAVVSSATAATDASGHASVTLTLGKSAGPYQYEASVEGVAPVQAVETATPPPPAAMTIVSGDGQADSVGRALALPLVVKVSDAFGNAAAGVAVHWSVVSGGGTLGVGTSTSNGAGTASNSYTLGTTAANNVIRAQVQSGGVTTVSVDFTARAISRGVVEVVMLSGGNQTGTTYSLLPQPLVVLARDAAGNPVAGATVLWTAPSGVFLVPPDGVTNSSGTASTQVAFGASPGTVTVTAKVAGLTASVQETITQAPPVSIAPYRGEGQTAKVGTAVAVNPAVIVLDATNHGVPNVTVTFALAGGGHLASLTAVTDLAGIATPGLWTLDTVAGQNTLTATAGSLTTQLSAAGFVNGASGLVLPPLRPTLLRPFAPPP